jgi:predicted ArsR family transcriptional regulator
MGHHNNSESELTPEDIQLVAELDESGPATPIELALRVKAQPEQLRSKLRKLKDEGWLGVAQRQGYEKEIYFVSKKGRSAVAHQ